MEGTFRATSRYLKISPRKLRQVAALVRGKPLDEAIAMLRYVPKKAGRLMEGALRSVQGNAKDRSQGEVSGLVIRDVKVDEGPPQRDAKRWMPKAMGRVGKMRRRTSHLQVVVARASGAPPPPPAEAKPAGTKAKKKAAPKKTKGKPVARKPRGSKSAKAEKGKK